MAGPTRADLVAYARQVAQRYGVDPDIFVRQIQQESNFDPDAHNPSGADGIGQLMPQYYPNVDTRDPYASLDAAASTMAANLKANGGDYARALAAYNAGQGNLNKYGLDGVMSPDFAQGQTLSYVNTILGSGGPKVQAAPEPGGQMAGTSTDITNGLHGPDDWQKIVDAHGGSYRMAPGQFKTDRWGTTTPDFSKPGTVVFADGMTALAKFYENNSVEVMPQPGVKAAPAAAAPKQVGTNTRDRTITTIDAQGNVTSVDNPNYAAAPTDVSSPTSQQWIVTRDANGVQHKDPNPNYIPPTQVGGVPIDDAIKTAQLLQDKLAMQVEQGRLTNETAAQHFNQWWQVNVEYPLKLHEARVAEVNAAQTASQNAQDIALRSLQYRVGPNFGADFARGNTTLAGGGGKITYNPDDFTFDMPNFNQIGQQAASAVTAQFHPADRALAAISPTAAANVGAPPPNVAAIPSMAARVPYTPPAAAPVAAQPGPTPYVGSGMRDRG